MTDTLKSICEQCIHLYDPQLDFLPEELQREREIILRDLRELCSAASLEQEKTVVVLAGCLFESLLYCFIQAQSSYIAARRGSFTFNPEYSLNNYINIFNRWFSNVLTIPGFITDYRDMVHINRELEGPPELCKSAAGDMMKILNTLLGNMKQYAGL